MGVDGQRVARTAGLVVLTACVPLVGCDKSKRETRPKTEPATAKTTTTEGPSDPSHDPSLGPPDSDESSHLPSVPNARALTQDATVIRVSYEHLRLDEKSVASLEKGELRSSDVHEHLVTGLFDGLSADTTGTICRLEVDTRVPYSTVVDVLYTTGRAGFRGWEFVVNSPSPNQRALPTISPKRQPLAFAALSIWDDGFRLSAFGIESNGFSEPKRIDKLEPSDNSEADNSEAKNPWAAYDAATLERALQDLRKGHPDAQILRLIAGNEIEFDVLAQTLSLALAEFDAVYLEAPAG